MSSYYTETEIVKNDFLFVSYKHDKNLIVNSVIESLLDKGVKLWYDADLVPGNGWDEFAGRLINHENCKGVIFFNSPEAFISGPVAKEREITLKKQKKCKENGVPFYIFPVNIGKPSTLRLIKTVFESLPDDDKQLETDFSLSRIQTIAALFPSNTIYCYVDPNDPTKHTEELYKAIFKTQPSLIDKSAIRMKEIADRQSTTQVDISLGRWKGKQTSISPAFLLSKNQIAKSQSTEYLIFNNTAYTFEKLTWIPLYCENDIYVLLCSEIVDSAYGGKERLSWIQNEFFDLAFSDNEKKHITSVRLLTEKDYAKVGDKSLFEITTSNSGTDSHWWIDAMASGALQKVVKKNGTIYTSGYNCRTKKSGIRPVITIHKDVLTKLI